jgi:hypothetical protein
MHTNLVCHVANEQYVKYNQVIHCRLIITNTSNPIRALIRSIKESFYCYTYFQSCELLCAVLILPKSL